MARKSIDLRRTHAVLQQIERDQPLVALMKPNTLARVMNTLRAFGFVERPRIGQHYTLTAQGRQALTHMHEIMRLAGLTPDLDDDDT